MVIASHNPPPEAGDYGSAVVNAFQPLLSLLQKSRRQFGVKSLGWGSVDHISGLILLYYLKIVITRDAWFSGGVSFVIVGGEDIADVESCQ